MAEETGDRSDRRENSPGEHQQRRKDQDGILMHERVRLSFQPGPHTHAAGSRKRVVRSLSGDAFGEVKKNPTDYDITERTILQDLAASIFLPGVEI
jgi:hypothetical protein